MPAVLDQAQRLFACALRDARDDAQMLPLLRDDGVATKRMDLYRDSVATACANALVNAYPVVHALVGRACFDGLARAYAQAHPSASGDLHRFGGAFAGFVAGYRAVSHLSYLADVATLEWLVHRARFAADSTPIVRASIAALSPAALLAERLGVQPACAWLHSRFPIVSLWRAHQPDADTPLPADIDLAETALVVRRGWRVDVLASGRVETEILGSLRGGATLAEAIATGWAADTQFDFARALVRWLDAGLLIEASGLQ
ncbi:MAG: DNA-binding domain-containing protein, partial [Rudaea sp.]